MDGEDSHLGDDSEDYEPDVSSAADILESRGGSLLVHWDNWEGIQTEMDFWD